MIRNVMISHYKGLAEAHLRFDKLNIITGKNGAGKSNIIDAMYFLHDAVADDLDTAITKRHGIESIRQWSKFRPFDLSIEVEITNLRGNGKYKIVVGSSRGNFRVKEEVGEWRGPSPFQRPQEAPSNDIYSGFTRNQEGDVKLNVEDRVPDPARQVRRIAPTDLFLTSLAGPFSNILSIYFSDIWMELSNFSSYSIYPNTLRLPQVVTRDETLNSDGSNLATIIKRINSGFRKEKDSLLESMKFVMPNVVDIQVRSAGGYYVPSLRVSNPGEETHDFNMSQVSDGTLRVLGLLTAFYQPNAPEKIAVEEPEQMVHPGVLPVLADAMKEFVQRKTNARESQQLFVTTHSPNFLDLFPPEAIFWAALHNGLTECGPISEHQLNLVKSELFTAGELLVSEGLFA